MEQEGKSHRTFEYHEHMLDVWEDESGDCTLWMKAQEPQPGAEFEVGIIRPKEPRPDGVTQFDIGWAKEVGGKETSGGYTWGGLTYALQSVAAKLVTEQKDKKAKSCNEIRDWLKGG